MGKKQISLWVDEDILRRFEDWRLGARKLSRTAAIVELMSGVGEARDMAEEFHAAGMARVAEQAVAAGMVVSEHTERPDSPSPVTEIKERLRAVKESCGHPKDREERHSWGVVCGECNSRLR